MCDECEGIPSKVDFTTGQMESIHVALRQLIHELRLPISKRDASETLARRCEELEEQRDKALNELDFVKDGLKKTQDEFERSRMRYNESLQARTSENRSLRESIAILERDLKRKSKAVADERRRRLEAEEELRRTDKTVKTLQKDLFEAQEFISQFDDNENGIFVRHSDTVTPDIEYILKHILPKFLDQFEAKSRAYQQSDGTNISANFGVVGQYMKMFDKIGKLRKPMFEDRGEGPDLEFEPVEEVLGDFFGHVLLAGMYWRKARTNKEQEATNVNTGNAGDPYLF